MWYRTRCKSIKIRICLATSLRTRSQGDEILSTEDDRRFHRPAVHPAAWTTEQIGAFWDNMSSIPDLQARYFSANHSQGILETMDRCAPLTGVVLDYGCGRGEFLDALLRRGLFCMGCDASAENVRTIRDKFAKRSGFLGGFRDPVKLEDLGRYPDVITLIEVVEHMPIAVLPSFLTKIRALLQPGGRIVLTTPKAEDLSTQMVLCPECGCYFHNSQHMTSIDPKVLERIFCDLGFQTEVNLPTLFRRNEETSVRNRIKRIVVENVLPAKAPHLLFAARRL